MDKHKHNFHYEKMEVIIMHKSNLERYVSIFDFLFHSFY